METKRIKKFGARRSNRRSKSAGNGKEEGVLQPKALTPAQKERIRRRLVRELAAQKRMLERKLRLLEEHDGFAETEDRDIA